MLKQHTTKSWFVAAVSLKETLAIERVIRTSLKVRGSGEEDKLQAIKKKNIVHMLVVGYIFRALRYFLIWINKMCVHACTHAYLSMRAHASLRQTG